MDTKKKKSLTFILWLTVKEKKNKETSLCVKCKYNCKCVLSLFKSPNMNKCFCCPCFCGMYQVKCQLWPQNVLLKSCFSFLHKQVHEINQQAVKVEITFVCSKSWHSVLKRKKKAQMSFHQRTYLCGKKGRGRGTGNHRDTAHSCSSKWAFPQTFFVSDRMETRLSQVFRPRLVLQILNNSLCSPCIP